MQTSERKICVVITRPRKQAEIWAEKLSRHGISSLCMPLLEITAFRDDNPDHQQQCRAIKNHILELDLYQKVIFVSQNAVEQALHWIDVYWPQIPVGVDFFAIGETTARFLVEQGLSVQNLATSNQSDMTSEALLMHPALQSVADEKILIVRGVGGRGYLADELRRRGAKVDYCEVYQRNIAADALPGMTSWINNQQAWNGQHYLLAFHSSETWNYFCDLAGKIQAANAGDLMPKFRTLSVLVPSARVEEEVNKSGFHHTILAKNATDEAMTQAVNHFIRSNQA